MESDLRPGVHFPPPTLFILGLAIAWLLETRVYRIRIAGPTLVPSLENAGIALLIAGLVLLFWGMLTFARARTGIMPGKPARQIVSFGPYRYTRNPMYTGMATAYIGGTFIMNSGWAFILLPFVMYLIFKLVVQAEERYLTAAFPDEYEEYKRRVRRWI